MRRFDVEHRVERGVGNRKRERIALPKLESVDPVAAPAEFDRGIGDVDPQHAARAEVALDIRGAAAPPAADLQDIAAEQIDPRRDAMVEVARIPLFLVLGRQFRIRSRVLVDIAVVHECPIFGAPGIGGERAVEAPPQSGTQLGKAVDGPNETFYDHGSVPHPPESRSAALAWAGREFNPAFTPLAKKPFAAKPPLWPSAYFRCCISASTENCSGAADLDRSPASLRKAIGPAGLDLRGRE
jgi:hypothetical protein